LKNVSFSLGTAVGDKQIYLKYVQLNSKCRKQTIHGKARDVRNKSENYAVTLLVGLSDP